MSDTEQGTKLNSIKLKVLNILSEYTESELSEVSDDTPLTDLDIDSVSLVEIIFDIEEHFDITIPEEIDLEKQGFSFTCIADITKLIDALTEE